MRAGGHLHGRHAISTGHLEGLSARSWLLISIAVFIVLSTLDLERRLHHDNNTVEDDLPEPVEVRHIKHGELHGRSTSHSSKVVRRISPVFTQSNRFEHSHKFRAGLTCWGRVTCGWLQHKKPERPKPGGLELKGDLQQQKVAGGYSYGLSEEPSELEFQDQTEDAGDIEDEEEESWNTGIEDEEEEPPPARQHPVPKTVSEAGRADATTRERAVGRAAERAAERAARFRQSLTECHRPKVMENFKEPYSLHDFIMTSRCKNTPLLSQDDVNYVTCDTPQRALRLVDFKRIELRLTRSPVASACRPLTNNYVSRTSFTLVHSNCCSMFPINANGRNLENQSSIWVARNPGKQDSEKIKIADVTRSLLRAYVPCLQFPSDSPTCRLARLISGFEILTHLVLYSRHTPLQPNASLTLRSPVSVLRPETRVSSSKASSGGSGSGTPLFASCLYTFLHCVYRGLRNWHEH
eukprot:531066-Prorocentrum_minimum.AAC.2